jgi:lipoate-protein ligase A
LVLSRNNPLLNGNRNQFFARFLQPAVATLADFQIEAAINPPADIVVNGRKISGNGAGDINGMAVYTGNILLYFDRRTMAGVLNLPDVRFRELMKLSLERFLTTMGEELSGPLDPNSIENQLIRHFATWLGEMEPACYTEEMKQKTKAVAGTLTDREFLELPGKRSPMRQIKINEQTYLRFRPIHGPNAEASGYTIQLLRNDVIHDLELAELSDAQNP